MDDQTTSIPAGATFIITRGIYDEYRVLGLFRSIVQIDISALQKDWAAYHDGTFRNFIDWLIYHGPIEPINSFELFIGDELGDVTVNPIEKWVPEP